MLCLSLLLIHLYRGREKDREKEKEMSELTFKLEMDLPEWPGYISVLLVSAIDVSTGVMKKTW